MQEEKWTIEQKLSMLEASSSAMADDLVRKSDIILHYCMEAGKHRNGKNNITITWVNMKIFWFKLPAFLYCVVNWMICIIQ